MASRRQPAAGKDSHMYCFVPEADVDIICLASYLKAFIDATATIRPSRHPLEFRTARLHRRRKFNTINRRSTRKSDVFPTKSLQDTLEDVISDTKDWQSEQQSREFREDPYDYRDSDTWQRRRKTGPTPARVAAVVGSRRRVPGRHDPNQPATFSEVPSYTSTQAPSIFSQDRGSTYTTGTEEIRPGDSISNAGVGVQYKAGSKAPNPRPGGPQPDPDAFRQLNLSDATKPNQGARVNTTVPARHAKDTKDDENRTGIRRPQDKATSGNRKDSLYDYH